MMIKKFFLFLTNVIGICPYHGQAVCNRSKIQTLEHFEVTNKNDVQRLIQVQTKVKWLEVYLSDISWLTAKFRTFKFFQESYGKRMAFKQSICHAVDFNCVKESIKELYMGDCLLDEKNQESN